MAARPGQNAHMSPFHPSVSAMLLPQTPANALVTIARGLQAEGYRPTRQAIPKSQHNFPGETAEFHLVAVGDGPAPLTLVVPSDPSRVFHLAVEISKGSKDMVFTAWRRFSGFAPVAKVFFDGKPQWKNGEDADHEVFYPVPTAPPAELRVPGPIATPTSPEVIETAYASLATHLQNNESAVEGALKSVWLHRRSRRQPT